MSDKRESTSKMQLVEDNLGSPTSTSGRISLARVNEIPATQLRVLTATLAAFCLATTCWIVWGLETRGDYFANASPLMFPSLFAGMLVGPFLGWKAKARIRLVIQCASVASSCFWLFVRDGWWVKSPPFR